jgi:hypothetical protein
MRAAIVPGDVIYILRFASPASPFDCLKSSTAALKARSRGNSCALRLARAKNATFFLTFTTKSYRKNVDPIVQNARTETFT